MKRSLSLAVVAIVLIAAGVAYYTLVPSKADIAFHAPKQCEYDRLQAIAERDGVDEALAEQIQLVTFSLTEGVRWARASAALGRALQEVDCSQVESYEDFKERVAREVQAGG